MGPAITRRPLRLSHDAQRGLLVACEYGAVPHLALDGYTAGITCRLSFLLRRPGGTVNGFMLDGLAEIDVDEHHPSLWDGPRFAVPVLGLTRASVAEIALRTRTTFGQASTADVAGGRAARRHARAGEHVAAERELRAA